ncbi:MAG: ATP-binding protein [Acidobacteriota bacterium]
MTLYHNILDHIGEGILAVDADTLDIVACNPRSQEHIGGTDLVGHNLREISWLGLTPAELVGFATTTFGHGVRQTLEVAQTRAGKTNYHEVSATPLLASADAPALVVLIERDLTETKQFERDLSGQLEQLRKLSEFSKALQGTTDLSEGLYIILVSVTAREGLGFNRAFILMYDEVEQALEGTVGLGPYDADEAGTIWSNLRTKHLSLAELLNSYPENRNYQQSRINELVRQIQIPGSARQNILIRAMQLGRPVNVLYGLHEGERIDDETIRLLRCESFAAIPLYTRYKRLGVLVADNSINQRPIGPGDIHSLQIFANHASAAIENTMLYKELREKVDALEQSTMALQENQAKLLRAERLSAIGKMAATIAHEIRNPLVSIGGFARRLAREMPADAPLSEDVGIIITEVMRLEKIVENIIDYARAHQLNLQPTDLYQVVADCVALVSEEANNGNIWLQVNAKPGFPAIEADGAQLKQVFLNLLVNAVHATPAGGSIRLGLSRAGDWVEVEVADSGVGIAPENMDKIFSAFFTTKNSGTGLGLTVVSEIVEAHGGFISVSSRPGQGTEFSVRLPVRQSVSTVALASAVSAE